MKLTSTTLVLMLAWLAPFLAFPSNNTSGYLYADFGNVSHPSLFKDGSAYAPFPVMLQKTRPASFFIPTKDRAMILNPHWRYWIYWVVGAMVLTVYAGRRRE